jgi:hypothetical protein
VGLHDDEHQKTVFFITQMRLLSIGLKLLTVTKLSTCENIAEVHGKVLITLTSKNRGKRREDKGREGVGCHCRLAVKNGLAETI